MPIRRVAHIQQIFDSTEVSTVRTRGGSQTYVCVWHVLGVACQIIEVSIKDFRNDEMMSARQLRHQVRH